MFCVIEKDCVGKYSDNIILLENPSFCDEAQEFDHLVIGPQGIFNIETKNYAGKLAIDKAGNWLRLKKGETEWVAEENPAQQVFRHRVLLQSIVGYQIPIIDVICLSHPSILIAGQENSRIPVIKKDLLADFIVNYRPAVLTSDHRNINFMLLGAEYRIPGNLSLSFFGQDGEILLHRLDIMGTCISTGSACDSQNTQISHVLRAMRISREYAIGAIRISFGKDNTIEEINLITKQLLSVL